MTRIPAHRRPTLRLIGICLAALCSGAGFVTSATGEPHIPAYVRLHAEKPSAEGGLLLISELNCVACHQADAALTSQLASKQAPLLTGVSERIKPEYLQRYIADAHAAKPGATMPDLRCV